MDILDEMWYGDPIKAYDHFNGIAFMMHADEDLYCKACDDAGREPTGKASKLDDDDLAKMQQAYEDGIVYNTQCPDCTYPIALYPEGFI
jgi:hypothetical protein